MTRNSKLELRSGFDRGPEPTEEHRTRKSCFYKRQKVLRQNNIKPKGGEGSSRVPSQRTNVQERRRERKSEREPTVKEAKKRGLARGEKLEGGSAVGREKELIEFYVFRVAVRNALPPSTGRCCFFRHLV